jgi:hypothetical protein
MLVAEIVLAVALIGYSVYLHLAVRNDGQVSYRRSWYPALFVLLIGLGGIFATPPSFYELNTWLFGLPSGWSTKMVQLAWFCLPIFGLATARFVVWCEDRPLGW